MSIKTQRVLRFIPLINLVTMFFWIKMYYNKSLKHSNFMKALFTMFLIITLITIPRVIVHFLLDSYALECILSYLSVYLYMLGISFVAVADQERNE